MAAFAGTAVAIAADPTLEIFSYDETISDVPPPWAVRVSTTRHLALRLSRPVEK